MPAGMVAHLFEGIKEKTERTMNEIGPEVQSRFSARKL